MSRILATAQTEFLIALRNRWVTIAVAMMVVFSLVLAAAGSAPSGALGADRLSVTVASLTSLSSMSIATRVGQIVWSPCSSYHFAR